MFILKVSIDVIRSNLNQKLTKQSYEINNQH